jgi:hypothetical protein
MLEFHAFLRSDYFPYASNHEKPVPRFLPPLVFVQCEFFLCDQVVELLVKRLSEGSVPSISTADIETGDICAALRQSNGCGLFQCRAQRR